MSMYVVKRWLYPLVEEGFVASHLLIRAFLQLTLCVDHWVFPHWVTAGTCDLCILNSMPPKAACLRYTPTVWCTVQP